MNMLFESQALRQSVPRSDGGTDEWLTPPHILAALGEFDLDPCAPIKRPWAMAAKHYTIEDNGLAQAWDPRARVWLNPPYSKPEAWLHKLAHHEGGGTALLFARTETMLWHELIWPLASAVCFIKGRLHFHHANGKRASANAGAASALIAYGEFDARVLAVSNLGKVVKL